MRLTHLFERTIHSITGKDIVRFKKHGTDTDINYDEITVSETENTKEKIIRHIHNGHLRIYRTRNIIGDPIEYLKKRSVVGLNWTYDLGDTDKYVETGEKYIIEVNIKEKYIDWDKTIASNTIRSLRKYNQDIYLFKGTRLYIDKLWKDNGTVLEDVDVSGLSGTVFKVR